MATDPASDSAIEEEYEDPLIPVIQKLAVAEIRQRGAQRVYDDAGDSLSTANQILEEAQQDFECAFEERKNNWREDDET